MRGLGEIVKANRDAVTAGVVKPGEAVGTGTVARYNVYHGRKKIKSNVTIAECADIRSIQHECTFKPVVD